MDSGSPTCGIVVAGGSGSRFGVPKQFETVAGARLVDRAVDAVTAACDDVVLVLPAGVAWDGRSVAATVPGGSTRSASVRAGLDAVAGWAAVVVVHDAARPLAPPALFDAVIDAVRAGADAAVPGPALVEAAGGRVVVVPGDPRNLKITTPADLVVAAALLVAASEEQR